MTDDVIDLLQKNEHLQAINAELLAALEALHTALDGRVHSNPALHALEQARAVIAKAKE